MRAHHVYTCMKKAKPMNLHDLLILKLQALYDVENQLVKALPKMAKSATDMELKASFEDHLEETKAQAGRIEEAFSLLDIKPKKTKVEAIRGLIDDTEWCIKNIAGATALDAVLISAAEYVEHYEMAGYGTAAEWARLMEHTAVADLLEMTLEEEQAASDRLMMLATTRINQEALGSDENTEDT